MNYTKATIELIARVCHEANRAICEANGDFSQDPWESTAFSNRISTRNGVEWQLNNPNAKPGGSHEEWVKSMTDQGWVYGPVKDPAAKTNPSLVPFEELNAIQQLKDHVFVAIVNSMSKS